MLENMLDWAKIQMGKMEFINEKFNVGERVNSIIEPYIPLFKYKSITCRINNTDKKKILNMDINTFDSVIRNLITNSIKFTNQNGRILIDIADSSDGMLIIKISDSGVGMTSEKIEEVLAGSKNISSFGTDGEKGSGIGMYLVKELIEKNNGKLKISSIQNIGTTVEVLLPCNQNN
jgi:Signal transduction histidine kinase